MTFQSVHGSYSQNKALLLHLSQISKMIAGTRASRQSVPTAQTQNPHIDRIVHRWRAPTVQSRAQTILDTSVRPELLRQKGSLFLQALHGRSQSISQDPEALYP
jgi:hypothetical protein